MALEHNYEILTIHSIYYYENWSYGYIFKASKNFKKLQKKIFAFKDCIQKFITAKLHASGLPRENMSEREITEYIEVRRENVENATIINF